MFTGSSAKVNKEHIGSRSIDAIKNTGQSLVFEPMATQRYPALVFETGGQEQCNKKENCLIGEFSFC